MNDLIDKVISWADERNLIKGTSDQSKLLKLVSNVGFLANDLGDKDEVMHNIGGCIGTLVMLAAQYDLTLQECLFAHYDDVKGIKSVVLDGEHIHSYDDRYEQALAVLGARRVDNSRNQMAAEIMSK